MISYEEFSVVFHTIMADNGQGRFVTEANSRKFYLLTEHLLEVSKVMNLTAIKDEKAIILRHYADSLTLASFLPENATLCDVGCGAGFPDLPLAICRPDLRITAIDSTEKRIRYVTETAKLLQLSNLTGIAARAEDVGRGSMRESFDVATARAVADLPVLSELCMPLVRPGGVFLAMKAARASEELETAQQAIKRLGGTVLAAHNITLRGENEADSRVIIEISKTGHTPPKFPRPYARILKKPL